MIVLSPALTVSTRQVIVAGRAAERFTSRPLDIVDAVLRYRAGPAAGPITATFHKKPEGYFALQLDPSRDVPDLTGAGTVTLDLTLTLEDGSEQLLSLDVPLADLTPSERAITINGQNLTALHMPGAPFTLDWSPDPAQPLLQGTVLLAGNPATPAAGLTVTVADQPPIQTNAEGQFRSGPLPLSPAATVRLTDGTDTVEHTHFTDFTQPLNTGVFDFQPDTN